MCRRVRSIACWLMCRAVTPAFWANVPKPRWRLRPDDLRQLGSLQIRLLRLAVQRVRPSGAIVYSTCSIEPEENRQVVETVLHEASYTTLEAAEESVPGRPADGGFWARLRRH